MIPRFDAASVAADKQEVASPSLLFHSPQRGFGLLVRNSKPDGLLESLAVFPAVALHGLLEFVVARAALLVDDRQLPFDSGQLAVNLHHAAIVLGLGSVSCVRGSGVRSRICARATARLRWVVDWLFISRFGT